MKNLCELYFVTKENLVVNELNFVFCAPRDCRQESRMFRIRLMLMLLFETPTHTNFLIES